MSVSAHVQELRKKHAHLSAEVEEAQRNPGADQLQIATLKKQKLRLKEEIARLSPH
ncbi:MAG: YdcH family protein [Pseudomonadota bacterium]